jgi:hypothetical protein
MYNPLYSQELQDEQTAFDKANKDSVPNTQVMKDLLAESEEASSSATYSSQKDLADLVVASHPNLTKSQAEDLLEEFGA